MFACLSSTVSVATPQITVITPRQDMCFQQPQRFSDMTLFPIQPSPNHALQRTAPRVTVAAVLA